jgi:hypothetical protein
MCFSVSKNWPSTIHSASAADDKSCIVGPFPLWFGDMMDCVVAVNRLRLHTP